MEIEPESPSTLCSEDCVCIRVHYAPHAPSKHEVFLVIDGQEIPLPFAQLIWDNEHRRQQEEKRLDKNKTVISAINDGVTYYMQQLQKENKGKVANFEVDFPNLGITYSWDILENGVSQWFCKIYGSPLGVKHYAHTLFPEKLVSAPRAMYRFLGVLLELAPYLTCGCVKCNRFTIGSAYYLTLCLGKNGTDPRPMPGGYMTLVVCEHLEVREFFHVLYGTYTHPNRDFSAMHPHRHFLRQIKGPDALDMYVYGDFYYYDDFEFTKTSMKDLIMFSDGATHATLATGLLQL